MNKNTLTACIETCLRVLIEKSSETTEIQREQVCKHVLQTWKAGCKEVGWGLATQCILDRILLEKWDRYREGLRQGFDPIARLEQVLLKSRSVPPIALKLPEKPVDDSGLPLSASSSGQSEEGQPAAILFMRSASIGMPKGSGQAPSLSVQTVVEGEKSALSASCS